jgi:hypothetical protein
LPEIDTAAKTSTIVIRLYMKDSGGAASQHNLARVGLTYYLP